MLNLSVNIRFVVCVQQVFDAARRLLRTLMPLAAYLLPPFCCAHGNCSTADVLCEHQQKNRVCFVAGVVYMLRQGVAV